MPVNNVPPEIAKQYDFKPGNPGGPGKPRLPNEIRNLPKLTREHLSRMLNIVFLANLDKLKSIMQDPKTPCLTLAYAKVMVKAIEKGDINRIEPMITRAIGPAPLLEINGTMDSKIQSLSKDQIIEKAQASLKRLMTQESNEAIDVNMQATESSEHDEGRDSEKA